MTSDERWLRHDAGQLRAPDVDRDLVAGLGVGWQERQRDALAEHGRVVARRDRSHDLAVAEDVTSFARRAPALGDDALQSPGGSGLPFRVECGAAQEIGLGPGDDPAEPGLERSDSRPEFVAVERETRLQAQRVPGAQTCRLQAAGDERLPDTFGVGRRYGDLQAGLTGIGASWGRRDLGTTVVPVSEPVIVSVGDELIDLGEFTDLLDVDFGTVEQYSVELFYRVQVTQEFQVTPSVQFIIDPAFNLAEDNIAVLGVRGRAEF